MSSSEVKEQKVEKAMNSQHQESLENEHISLLHEKLLQENSNFSLTPSSQANNARSRHTSNTKIQRLKPSSTAPAAPNTKDMDSPDGNDQTHPLVKRTSFHGFPVELDGDTQPIPSQFYRNYTSGIGTDEDTQFDQGNAPDNEQETPQIDLMQHWQQQSYHEISSDNEDEHDEGQYFLSSVNRPTFPKTPATAGRKRNHRGDLIPSTTSTKTPGSGGMSAFGFENPAPLSGTQLFQATQAPSSDVPDVPRSDPILSRPSPNIRHSSPGPQLNFSSPLKGLLQSPSRSVNMAGRLSRPGTRDGDVGNGDGEAMNREELGENEWEYNDREGFSLEDDIHDSPDGDSMDEYDEFAQELRPSQRQISSSPRSNKSEAENDHVESSSRTSTHSSPSAMHLSVPHASAPSGRQHSSIRLPTTQPLNHDGETADYAVADSQPTRETQPPPPLVEPSSMSSIVPGSYPFSQTNRRLEAVKYDADDSSSIPKPPPTTSQFEPPTESRLPSSPPQLPTISEQSTNEDHFTGDPKTGKTGADINAPVASSLPKSQLANSKRLKELEHGDRQHESDVPETDPADGDQSSNRSKKPSAQQENASRAAGSKTAQLQTSRSIGDTGNEPHGSSHPASQFNKHRASQLQLQSQNQSQGSAATAESPRKAAGILGFADIGTDPTPPDAVKDFDLNLDLLSNDDHDFMDAMSSPPAKKMRMYGKRGRTLDKSKAKASTKSPSKASAKAVVFREASQSDSDHENTNADASAEVGVVIEGAAKETDELALREEDASAESHVTVEAVQEPLEQRIGAVQETPQQTSEHAQHMVDRTIEPDEHLSPAEKHPQHDDSHRLSEPSDMADQVCHLPKSPEKEAAKAAAKARDHLLVRKQPDTRTPDGRSSPGRLVRPKRGTSEHSPLRTPTPRTRGGVNPPRSRLSHVQRNSQGDTPEARDKAVETPKQGEREQETTTSTDQPQHHLNTDVVMTNAAPERTDEQDGNTDAEAEVTQPDRVMALFKGTGQAYYPATCLGAATLDGQKLRIRFDDGTVTQLDSGLVRRLDLRRGDQVKVDLKGMRSKVYVIVGFQDKAQDVAPDSYPKTDVHGFETVQLVPKDRDSMPAVPRVETAILLKVPITNVYLTQTMWVRFEGRDYLPSNASMTTAVTGYSSRMQTPVPQQHTTPATPASRSRRGTLTSNQSWTRPDLASPLPPGRGVFAGMAFAVSYTADTPEKDRALELIQLHGGLILEKGFDELFIMHGLDDAGGEPQAPATSSPAENDSLILSSRAQSLGFVALIADKHSRRAKYVQALALSLPCLSGRWVLDSVASNTPLSWTKYLLPAGESAFLSGAVRSRTLQPYSPTSTKLANTVQAREKLLQGGRVLLASAGTGGRKWEARRAYAFLTVALGASVVRRVSGLESAKRILDSEDDWGWVYVEGSIDEAERVLFRSGSIDQPGSARRSHKKRKRDDGESSDKMVAVGREGKVRIVGDEFVVQSLILGDLML